MSMISERIKKLGDISLELYVSGYLEKSKEIYEAADTIKSLSAKLQVANMERSADSKMIDGKKLLEDLEKEVFTADLYEHGWGGQKFLSYANFIAKSYEEEGEERSARIIRKRIDGTYKNEPKVVARDSSEK